MRHTLSRDYATFIGDCVSFNSRSLKDREALSDMVDNYRDVSYRTLIRHVPVALLAELFPHCAWGPGQPSELRLKDDWSVRFCRSTIWGKRCYYVRWSAIEFIFMEENH